MGGLSEFDYAQAVWDAAEPVGSAAELHGTEVLLCEPKVETEMSAFEAETTFNGEAFVASRNPLGKGCPVVQLVRDVATTATHGYRELYVMHERSGAVEWFTRRHGTFRPETGGVDWECDLDEWSDESGPDPRSGWIGLPLKGKEVRRFPRRPEWDARLSDEALLVQPHPRCDVFAMREPDSRRLAEVQRRLARLADETQDFPVPKYQNIIDPNLFAFQGRWVASEWDVSGDGEAALVGRGDGTAHHVAADDIDAVFTPMLQLALPVLANKLARPALHLAGRRLQAVCKAQRIIVSDGRVEGEAPDTEPGAYAGLWHQDGDVEDIVAAVLYYADVDTALEGGAMEFMSREPVEVLGRGDCSNNFYAFTKERLADALQPQNGQPADVPRVKVPVETGTVLVFSNYQMVHRVLRMVNTAQGRSAARTFAALFIANPAARLPAATEVLQTEWWKKLTRAEREAVRLTKLKAQLEPAGSFGNSDKVYSTGNGCFTMLSWLHEKFEDDALSLSSEGAIARWEALTFPPSQLHRGMSELASVATSQLGGYPTACCDGHLRE